MKASKFIVLVGGLVGILAFFLPLVAMHRGELTGTVSAFQVIKGLDEVSVAAGSQDMAVSLATAGESARSAQDAVSSMKGIVLAVFVPALLLALIGGLGIVRKKFERVAGTFSLLLGLAGLGIASILNGAAEGDGGVAISLLLAAGTAGVVGGLIALVRPERLAVAQPTRFPAVVAQGA